MLQLLSFSTQSSKHSPVMLFPNLKDSGSSIFDSFYSPMSTSGLSYFLPARKKNLKTFASLHFILVPVHHYEDTINNIFAFMLNTHNSGFWEYRTFLLALNIPKPFHYTYNKTRTSEAGLHNTLSHLCTCVL
jgi:hypothetical protein